MTTKIRWSMQIIFIFIVALAMTASVWAATRKKTVAATTVIYVPEVKLVCNPCSQVSNSPSSTTNPTDVCCEYQVVGWQQIKTTP